MGRFLDVESLDDPRLAAFRLNERGLASRADKRDDAGAGLFLAEGDLVVERALDAGCEPVAALADADRRAGRIGLLVDRLVERADVFVGGEDVRREVTGLGMPHAVIVLFRRPPRPSATELLDRCRRIVVLEAVDNPANVGAIVRNAAALGWDGLLLDHTSADPLARRSLRVAMGTAFTIPHARTDDLAAVLGAVRHRIDLVALTPAEDADHIDHVVAHLSPGRRRALLVGSERAGLSDELLALAHHRARIPMSGGVDSLNAASATAVAAHVLR